jgi:hypothetical protein
MRAKKKVRRAMAAMVIQAPGRAHPGPRNFVVAMMTVTTPVATAPTAFTARLAFAAADPSRYQCNTMPACESVNPTKTPRA